jgi:hypothetical protein
MSDHTLAACNNKQRKLDPFEVIKEAEALLQLLICRLKMVSSCYVLIDDIKSPFLIKLALIRSKNT